MAEKKQWEINKAEYNKRYSAKYDVEYNKTVYRGHLNCHNIHYAEMINFLNSKENVSEYIRDLIRADMERSKNNEL